MIRFSTVSWPTQTSIPTLKSAGLFYVALTRARRDVMMFAVRSRESPFLVELIKDGPRRDRRQRWTEPRRSFAPRATPGHSSSGLGDTATSSVAAPFLDAATRNRCPRPRPNGPRRRGQSNRAASAPSCRHCGPLNIGPHFHASKRSTRVQATRTIDSCKWSGVERVIAGMGRLGHLPCVENGELLCAAKYEGSTRDLLELRQHCLGYLVGIAQQRGHDLELAGRELALGLEHARWSSGRAVRRWGVSAPAG